MPARSTRKNGETTFRDRYHPKCDTASQSSPNLSKTERTRSFQAQQQRALRKRQMDLLPIQVRRRHRTRDWCISRDADQFSILGTCALCDCEHFCWRDCIEFTTTVTISYRDPVFLLALQIVKLL